MGGSQRSQQIVQAFIRERTRRLAKERHEVEKKKLNEYINKLTEIK